ncbi:uncharacterized protein GGS22DRAFT_153893 [Annulohypoxylon maeteangense]|uniref:uncharacterized protein n=1 Tax=Annulohypoxylon maeteangense TaxID=1927788 RepID=UPI0020073F84|nr:uncharacterized protein GGS22DRAFT_153893 [Annulohypoxylon maeteangense]KAI0889440.1 hypothetical protein GGS22DRAFT_153893 [Annulohypoxylon maeteangense]
MATIIIRVETTAARECEVIDLTVPSREPSVQPVMGPKSSSTTLGTDRCERESSRTLSREVTPAPPGELAGEREIQELDGPPAIFKGKQVRRSPSPAIISRSRVEVEVVSPSRSTVTVAEASNSNSVSELSATAERGRSPIPTATNGINSNNNSPKQLKRRYESPEITVIVKEESGDYNAPSSPIDEYPRFIKADDSDDDKFEFSPKKQRGSSPEFDLTPIPFYRSSTPSPLPLPIPFHHPEYPDRPALRCPKKNPEHLVIEREESTSSRNPNRLYYKCRDCPGYGSFICWADSRLTWAAGRTGVTPKDRLWPRCWCGHAAREDITGDKAKNPNTLWYKCATDACRFRRWDSDDPLSPEEINQYSGSQVYQIGY